MRKAQWENEKNSVERLSTLREQIEEMNRQIQQAQQKYDLNKAAELQYGELPKLQQQLAAEEEKVKNADLFLSMKVLPMKRLPGLFPTGPGFRWRS